MARMSLKSPRVVRGQPLRVLNRAIGTLKLDPKNARLHSAGQVRQIARSVETFGFNVPVLVDGNGKVVAGHGRVLACQVLGWTEVPTIALEHLSEVQAKAFMIADNRLTETSVWDDRLLGEQLRELSLLQLDFSLEVTGFEMAEIDLRIEKLGTFEEGAQDPADVIPQPGLSVSQSGDLWQLGRHRLYCGSTLDPKAFALLMGPEKAAMVFTDPPYNVRIDGHATGLGSTRHREFAMASGEMSEAEFTDFLTRCCELLTQNSTSPSLHFICMDWAHAGELLAASKLVYSDLKNICVWVKHNAGMGSLYRGQHELVFLFKHGLGPHRNNVQLGRYGRHRSNVWNYRGANDFGRASEEGNLSNYHPTVKPVQMIADAILDCSKRGDIVLDAFLGSGSTMIAAERTGRNCFAIEIDPLYVDVAICRWQAFTGDQAQHVATGQKFSSLRRKASIA